MTDRADKEAPLDDHAAEPCSDSGAACREPLTARGQARAGLTPPGPGNNRYPQERDVETFIEALRRVVTDYGKYCDRLDSCECSMAQAHRLLVAWGAR